MHEFATDARICHGRQNDVLEVGSERVKVEGSSRAIRRKTHPPTPTRYPQRKRRRKKKRKNEKTLPLSDGGESFCTPVPVDPRHPTTEKAEAILLFLLLPLLLLLLLTNSLASCSGDSPLRGGQRARCSFSFCADGWSLRRRST